MRVFLGIGVVAAVILAVINIGYFVSDPVMRAGNLSAALVSMIGAVTATVVLWQTRN